jgi:hypothetical protein
MDYSTIVLAHMMNGENQGLAWAELYHMSSNAASCHFLYSPALLLLLLVAS